MEPLEGSDGLKCSKQTNRVEEQNLAPKMIERAKVTGKEETLNFAEKFVTEGKNSHPDVLTPSQTFGSVQPVETCDQCKVHPRKKTTHFPSTTKLGFQLENDHVSDSLCKKEQKPKKPGKYVCHYCGRACAKPSVLKKHIRSHTGERPYPCVPCGFSFKTKSNLYKHRKSHTHAVKARLISPSGQDTKHVSVEEEFQPGEVETHSDAEQSTDTDEEGAEDLILDRNTSVYLKERGGTTQGKDSIVTQEDTTTTSVLTPFKKNVPSASGKVTLSQLRKMMATPAMAQVDQAGEFSTIKQRLALRLSEKKSQDSDHSLTLPSSYSKGSTDSGYFSRSESAEHQISQPSSSAKSYQEIMFGKCYKPSTKPRQSITVQTCMTDTNESMSSFMVNKGRATGETMPPIPQTKKDIIRSLKVDSESFQEEDYQDSVLSSPFQSNSECLETPMDTGSLIRSNSLPTSSESNLAMPQGLRGSNSFDERMTNIDVSYRGSGSMRKLMRQAAFEFCAHEGQTESDNHGDQACGMQKPELKLQGTENDPENESCLGHQSHIMEIATRKRRKDKGVVEEEDVPSQKSVDNAGQSDVFDFVCGLKDQEHTAGSNVISVIQHTNSIGRLGSVERSVDFESYNVHKYATNQSFNMEEEGQKVDQPLRPEAERQWGNSRAVSQRSHMPQQLLGQSGIQVPEIRVTEEPDRSEEVPGAQSKQREKHVEEFQWPQRSETLAQFPVEKLPPKKKRLRLAEIEYSSGESSFESACTSLSRSPSQESNFSHNSSFSMSLDREESVNITFPTKQDELCKPLDFLPVPGEGHTLAPPSQNHHKEMRRSSSEQSPCTSPIEVPELRSKSFDYGSLSSTCKSGQGDTYQSLCGSRDRRRGCLVRQASLSMDPEIGTQEKPVDMNVMQDSSDHVCQNLSPAACPDSPFLVFAGGMKHASGMQYSLFHDRPALQQSIQTGLCWKPEEIPYAKQHIHFQSHLPQDMYGLQYYQLKNEQGDSQEIAHHYVSLRDLPEDCPEHLMNVLSTISVLSQVKPVLAHQCISSHQLQCSSSVPVRIQMQVPSYGKVMYTSMSQILEPKVQIINPTTGMNKTTSQSTFVNVTTQHISGNPGRILHNQQLSPAKLNTGIPLSLTSKTISTTEAPSSGANKRMLSPASSIELFTEAKQLKRENEEMMYGQIVEELSAVELGNHVAAKEKKEKLRRETKNIQHKSKLVQSQKDEPPLLSDHCPSKTPLSSSLSSSSISQEDLMIDKMQEPGQFTDTHCCTSGTTLMLNYIASDRLFSQVPSLHTTTCVSWCYLNTTKPNSTQSPPLSSVYDAWFVKWHNPNPPNLSTRSVLALLRSRQEKHISIYTVAAMYQPGLLASSTIWRQRQEQGTLDSKEKDKHNVRIKDIAYRSKHARNESKESEASLKQTVPARVKIFEGGFKSNEDYVYVRGRGRGKYICEECGIRCKKPSMLRKHIRTHTDVRPYICKSCNFAFKTKGNLTKHMKSKAHMKKCLELGVSTNTMDIAGDVDNEDDTQRGSAGSVDTTIKHQFSDVDDSDGGDEDGDELDDDEDEEYDGDSTPKTISRSTSPQSHAINRPLPTSCFTKHSSMEIHVASTSKGDDLTVSLPEQPRTFHPCPSHPVLPVCDPPTHRYLSPIGDMSPRGHLFPVQDSSPVRAVCHRSDLSIRSDVLPMRKLSPARPISPGTDMSRQRPLSPQVRQRGALRAVSPRRGSYQHRAHLDHSRGIRCEISSLKQTTEVKSKTGMDQRGNTLQNLDVPVDLSGSNDSPTFLHKDILSHLPLHSQKQVQTPLPMAPIGGIRVPYVPSAGISVAHHMESPLQGNQSQTESFNQSSTLVLGQGFDGIAQQRSKPSSCTHDKSERAQYLISKDKRQEESIQICTEAIATLRITSEDLPGRELFVLPIQSESQVLKAYLKIQRGAEYFKLKAYHS
ncbi:transcription factor HIVEP2 [Chanos chanos]|uniref:Transcription factor HIVEP2 n=1 Tax=Chanos chanos TaxID=29144 RepID=A0A6J2WF40_CHACN|nr:transcription factor HIVEP2-like [Chanos chanos]